MSEHFDALETRDPEAREAALMAALPDQLARAKRTAAYARRLADVDPAAVRGREALARLPLTRKSELADLQRSDPPFAGFAAAPVGEFPRVFASPGPIFEPQGRRPDPWRFARALFATGFRRGDLVHNCFSYHFTPGAWMLDEGARALGCAVFPAGPGNTEQQVEAVARLRPRGYVGTPDYLKAILEKGDEAGADLSSIRLGHVSGGAFLPDVRRFYAERGIEVFQSYATADLGLVAYESPAREGLIVDEEVIVEIVRPGTGDPVPDGEVGEVVVTVLDPDYPLVRFATGDLSAFLPGASPCGRTNRRIRGWMGRADQTTKVKGMFVHPGQIAEVARRHPEVRRIRLVVDRADGQDVMALKVEADPAPDGLSEAVAATLHALTRLRGTVAVFPPGSLPNDGKVIEDARRYD